MAIHLDRIKWFAAGLLAAVVVHYMLYRIGLPIEPFIYVSF
jgi:hypothetical protein